MNYPFLIIHGWGKGSQSWQRVKELLENKGYRVLVPDLPGFGNNPAPIKPWSINDYVVWVKDFVTRSNLSNFILLGHSFGGAVVVKYAIKYPQDIKKLFLIAPALIRQENFKIKFFKKITKFLNKIFKIEPSQCYLRKVFYKLFRIKSDYPSLKGVMKETYFNILKEDLSAELNKISLPTIIIWGGKDDVLSVKQADLIKKEIKKAKLIIIPNANHYLCKTQPQELVDKILENIN